MYFMRRHFPWLASLAVGIVLLGGGAYMVFEGVRTRNELRDELRAEQVFTSDDTPRPGALIEDAETARMQADVIRDHTLGTWGPYSELPREDPRRAQFIDGVTLRTSLNMAVMGFGVTQLVIGGGLIITLAGLATVLLATPGLYILAGMVVPPPDRRPPERGELNRRHDTTPSAE